MRVAYLVNQYPRPSHTFIRREIEALEALELEVGRFSIQDWGPGDIGDEGDRREAEQTRPLLRGGLRALLGASARVALGRPRDTARAAWRALRLGRRSERGVLRNLAYLAEAALLLRWLREGGYEHVHAHFGTNSAAVALLCRELGGPEFSFTVHGTETFDSPHSLSINEKVAAARFVVAVCSFGRSQLYRHSALASWERIHVVRCSVDADWLQLELTPIPSTPHLVCVGRLCEQKGQLVLVRAVAALAKQGHEVFLELVGDGPLRGAIEAEVRALGVEANVRLSGLQDQEGVRAAIARARAFVLPSFGEGLPVAIMEALAMGRPVVSTFVAGIPELVVPGESGWLVPAASVSALRDALQEVLQATPEELSAMGQAGRERVKRQHDAALNGAQLAQLLQGRDVSAPLD